MPTLKGNRGGAAKRQVKHLAGRFAGKDQEKIDEEFEIDEKEEEEEQYDFEVDYEEIQKIMFDISIDSDYDSEE